MNTTPKIKIRVWDLFVRFFHWTLVVAVSTAAYSGFLLGGTWIEAHIWAGSVAAALILARLLWGIWGSPYARFGNFVKGPGAALEHVREIRSGQAHRHLGHNPLGGLMILALITTILFLALTGTVGLGGVFKVGPFGFATTYQFGSTTLSLHKLLAIWLLFLVVLHIGGAIFEGLRTRENLVKAMVTGYKEAEEHTVPPAGTARPVLAATAFAALAAILFWGGASLASRPVPDLPPASEAAFDPVYADECSACHIAYNPSLMGVKSWTLLMSNLSDHFGEDASLDPATTDEILRWLTANAAESVDTKPAHVLRRMAGNAPFTITETPFWKQTHRNIPDTVFRRPPIYDNGNCTACHSDAESGRFYPANISIPKETQQ